MASEHRWASEREGGGPGEALELIEHEGRDWGGSRGGGPSRQQPLPPPPPPCRHNSHLGRPKSQPPRPYPYPPVFPLMQHAPSMQYSTY